MRRDIIKPDIVCLEFCQDCCRVCAIAQGWAEMCENEDVFVVNTRKAFDLVEL